MNEAFRPELLAPAGSMEALTAAIRCGTDAVYIGGQQFSARHSAENFTDDSLRSAAEMCHVSGVKLYLAVNTLLTEGEYPALDRLLELAAAVGVDACIVQDFGVALYIREKIPQMPLHASTQMTIHTADGIAAAKHMGFCRVVLARELNGETIAALTASAHAMEMETELFVHGAHCMSVSGQCWLSAAMGGRSANRGRCAQPCRLPFTARKGAHDAYALSLKDMCLLSHIPQIAAMGVDSLKIEGRMKRPEYVAAAVTAYRKALDGETPDREILRAIFSRSGFTDGYFSGVRRDMFGTRNKEDVVAAQTVLSDLRETYRKPRKIVTINGHFVITQGKPATLTITAADGFAVQVSGDPPLTAQQHPADAAVLRRQFDKLGDTIYTCGEVTTETDGSSMLPAAALNAMRRDAVAALNAARIAENTPHYDIQAPPAPSTQIEKQTAQTPPIWLMIRRLSQLDSLWNVREHIGALLLPLHLANTYAQTPLLSPSQCILIPPRWCTDEIKSSALLQQAKALGFSRLGCGHIADVEMGRKLNMALHGVAGLHLFSRFGADSLRQMGLADCLLSPELPIHEAKTLSQTLPTGIFAYGRLPLMLMHNCPIQAEQGCKGCSHGLTDRKGQTLYTDCTRCHASPDYAELFNSAVVWQADRLAACRHAAYLLLSMTDESPQQVLHILRAYCGEGDVTPPPRFTRGLRLADDTPKRVRKST